MKLGVLGGTFDPIHLGHLAAAEAARSALALDRVLFVPAGDPWLKAGATISPGEHRLAMVRAAIAGVPAYEASTVEVDRPGPTYTEVTLAQLQETYGPDTELHFIVGADTVHDLARWHEPAEVLARCTLVVMGRPAQGELDLSTLDRIAPGLRPAPWPSTWTWRSAPRRYAVARRRGNRWRDWSRTPWSGTSRNTNYTRSRHEH